MRIQYGGHKLIVWIVVAIVTLTLMCGSCGIGAVLAPQLGYLFPEQEQQRAGPTPATTHAATPMLASTDVLDETDVEERLVTAIYERVAP
jgi:hypothetical protein